MDNSNSSKHTDFSSAEQGHKFTSSFLPIRTGSSCNGTEDCLLLARMLATSCLFFCIDCILLATLTPTLFLSLLFRFFAASRAFEISFCLFLLTKTLYTLCRVILLQIVRNIRHWCIEFLSHETLTLFVVLRFASDFPYSDVASITQ